MYKGLPSISGAARLWIHWAALLQETHLMMRRFFENKIAFAATTLAFAVAMGVNARFTAPTSILPSVSPVLAMFDDPNIPPPPWCDTCCPGCPDTKKPDGL